MITELSASDAVLDPPPRVSRSRVSAGGLLILAIALALASGCAPRKTAPPRACSWIVGAEAPMFDPDGPPQSTRWALERYLTRGLVEEDSSGRIVPAAARS